MVAKKLAAARPHPWALGLGYQNSLLKKCLESKNFASPDLAFFQCLVRWLQNLNLELSTRLFGSPLCHQGKMPEKLHVTSSYHCFLPRC